LNTKFKTVFKNFNSPLGDIEEQILEHERGTFSQSFCTTFWTGCTP